MAADTTTALPLNRVYGEGEKDADGLNILPPDLAALALSELHEDPKTRMAFIESLRAKILADERYKANFDTRNPIMLRFARARKYDLDRAAALFYSYHEFIDKRGWTEMDEDSVNKIMEAGTLYIPINGRDNQGRQLACLKIAGVMSGRHSVAEAQRLAFWTFDHLMSNGTLEAEATQILGVCMYQNMDMGPTAGFTDFPVQRDEARGAREIFEDALPARFKGMYVANQPWFFSMVWGILKNFLSKKMVDRITLVGALENFPNYASADILPTFLGGRVEVNFNEYGAMLFEKFGEGKRFYPTEKFVVTHDFSAGVTPLGMTVVLDPNGSGKGGHVRVSAVAPGGVAEQMGVRAGDFTMVANDYLIYKAKDLKPSRGEWKLTFYRPSLPFKSATPADDLTTTEL